MSVSEHANYLLNEFGRLQFDYAAYCKPYGESLRNEARNNLETYIAELEAENAELKERVAMLDVNSIYKSLAEMGHIEQVYKLNARIAELEGLVDKLIEAGDWGAKLAINIGALSGDNQYKLAKKRYDKWDALVKDWKEREE